LIPVPALAIPQGVAHKKVVVTQTPRPGQATAPDLVTHQTVERRQFNQFSKALRAQFRGSDTDTRKQVQTVIKNVFRELKGHWRLETRLKTILSPFAFPAV